MSATNCENLFIENQIKYVDSVDDKNLRADLLHQIRLRDNMSGDRDAFEKRCNELTDIIIGNNKIIKSLEERIIDLEEKYYELKYVYYELTDGMG